MDTPLQRGGRPSFQEWLNEHHGDRNILVKECPTLGYRDTIPLKAMDKIKVDILHLISMGRTVILVDFGGSFEQG